MTERDDATDVDGIPQSERYGSIISALPFTLVHLTGDYPLIDYTTYSRVVLAAAMLVAVGVPLAAPLRPSLCREARCVAAFRSSI